MISLSLENLRSLLSAAVCNVPFIFRSFLTSSSNSEIHKPCFFRELSFASLLSLSCLIVLTAVPFFFFFRRLRAVIDVLKHKPSRMILGFACNDLVSDYERVRALYQLKVSWR